MPALDGGRNTLVARQCLAVMPDRVGVQRPDGAQGNADDVVDIEQQVIVGGDEYGPVKGQVGLDERGRLVDGRGQAGQGAGDRAALRRAGRLRGQPCGSGLKRYPQVRQDADVRRAGLGCVPPAKDIGIEQVPRLAGAYPGARAGPALQKALARQHLDSLAERRPADLELAHQFVLGGHGGAGPEFTAHDPGAQPVHDLGVTGLCRVRGGHDVPPGLVAWRCGACRWRGAEQ